MHTTVQMLLCSLVLLAVACDETAEDVESEQEASADARRICSTARDFAFELENVEDESAYPRVQSSLDRLERAAFDSSEPELAGLVTELESAFNWPSSASRPWYDVMRELANRCERAGAPMLNDVDAYLCKNVPAFAKRENC